MEGGGGGVGYGGLIGRGGTDCGGLERWSASLMWGMYCWFAEGTRAINTRWLS